NQAIQQIPHQPTGTGLAVASSSAVHASPHPHPPSHHHHHHHPLSMQNKDQQPISKEKFKLLLVVDDHHTD
ncbi:unnamed protein product, partial [Rotaria magnacalcarata]